MVGVVEEDNFIIIILYYFDNFFYSFHLHVTNDFHERIPSILN